MGIASNLRSRRRTSTPRRRWRVLVTIIGCVLLLVSLAGLFAHYYTFHPAKLIGVAAFSPYLMLGAPIGLILLAVSRNLIGLAVAVALTAWVVLVQAPLFLASTAPSGSDLIVMTSNLRLGGAEPQSVVDAVKRHHVDVLMLEELTTTEVTALEQHGLDSLLPHHIADARGGGAGTGLWSRYPLVDPQKHENFTFAFVTADVRPFADDRTVRLAAVHMAGPYPYPADWLRDIGDLPAVLRGLASSPQVLVGGDFNATPDIAQFRRLLATGYQDAANQAGAGVTATYPADRWFPPMIAIDHVLTRGAVARSVDTVHIDNSDHRALVVSVRIPHAATSG